MTDLIIGAVVVLVVGMALAYIIKEKKKGVRCIGCSHAGTCASKAKSSSGCGCGSHQ